MSNNIVLEGRDPNLGRVRRKEILALEKKIRKTFPARVHVEPEKRSLGAAYFLWILAKFGDNLPTLDGIEDRFLKHRRHDKGTKISTSSLTVGGNRVIDLWDEFYDTSGVERVYLNSAGRKFVGNLYKGKIFKKKKKPSEDALLGEYIRRGLRGSKPRKETEEFVKGRQQDIFGSMRKHMQSEVYDNPPKKKVTKNSPSANPSTLPRPGDPIRKAFPIGSKIPGLLSPQGAKGHAVQRVWTVAQSYSAKKDWGIDLDTKTIASRDLRLMIRKQGDRVKFTLITPLARYYFPNNAEIDIKKGTVVSLKYGGENMNQRGRPVPTVFKHEASVHEIVASGIIWAAETVDLRPSSPDGIRRVNGYVPRHEDLVSAVVSNIGKRSPSHVEIITPNLIGELRVFPAKQNKKNPAKKAAKKKPTKKKATKKKVTSKKTPTYQLLINRCQKLWDHYCERPSKSRLKPVLEHLEKMKASTSKKVADERKRCLRVANKEARRLKMK